MDPDIERIVFCQKWQLDGQPEGYSLFLSIEDLIYFIKENSSRMIPDGEPYRCSVSLGVYAGILPLKGLLCSNSYPEPKPLLPIS